MADFDRPVTAVDCAIYQSVGNHGPAVLFTTARAIIARSGTKRRLLVDRTG